MQASKNYIEWEKNDWAGGGGDRVKIKKQKTGNNNNDGETARRLDCDTRA